jgi:hypothetical protein
MDSSASSLVSPEITVSSFDYFTSQAQRPRHGSSGSMQSTMSSPQKGSRSERGVDPGLGIQMAPLPSPTSPDSIYRLSPYGTHKGGYSPVSSTGYHPKYFRSPDSATSYGSPMSRARTDPMTERLIQQRATQAADWKVHWRTPALMVFSFLTGILLAVGQHFLYKSLHHKAYNSENTKVRVVLYGRALAYSSKVAFGSCVVLCYRQRIWRTFRERALSVFSIDQLFLATEDPSLFLNWETITKATIVTAMALVLWMIPIATIVRNPRVQSACWRSRSTTQVVFRKALPTGFVLLYSTLLKSLPLTLYPPL